MKHIGGIRMDYEKTCALVGEMVAFHPKRARKISIFTVYILLMLACALIIKFVVPSIYKSIIDLVNNLPAYYEQAINYIKELPEDSVLKKVDLISAIENLGNIDFKRYLDIQTVTQYIKSVLGLAGVVFDIFVTIIISIYILLERRDILKFARKLCSAMFKTSVYKDIGKYFTGIVHASAWRQAESRVERVARPEEGVDARPHS